MRKFKTWALNVAEAFDAWRIVPRAMLVSYGYLVWSMYVWYRSIPLHPQIKCDFQNGTVALYLWSEACAGRRNCMWIRWYSRWTD